MKALFTLLFACLFFYSSSYLFPRDVFALYSRRALAQTKLMANAVSSVTAQSSKSPLEEFLTRKKGPDFYWKYRLDRLKRKKGDVYPFKASNYPGKTTEKDLYEVYYLDLVLKGKMEGFDIEKEQIVDEDEWRLIFREMAAWTQSVDQSVPKESLPDSPFDLLSVFFPEMRPAFQQLESPLNDPEIPYKNTREFIEDAFRGKFVIPGVTGDDDSAAYEKQLSSIEADALKRVEELRSQLLAEVDGDKLSLDEQSKSFYRRARDAISNLPITNAEWEADRERTKRLVDEMADLASTEEEEHHHGGHKEGEEGHDDHHHHEKKLSIPEQFKQKYGRDLKKMQDRLAKFNSNPNNYLENVATEAVGREGLELWKEVEKTFDENYSKLSEAERVKLQRDFKAFVSKLPLD